MSLSLSCHTNHINHTTPSDWCEMESINVFSFISVHGRHRENNALWMMHKRLCFFFFVFVCVCVEIKECKWEFGIETLCIVWRTQFIKLSPCAYYFISLDLTKLRPNRIASICNLCLLHVIKVVFITNKQERKLQGDSLINI